MIKYLPITLVFLFFSACSAENRAALVRSYSLHPRSFISPEELLLRMRSNPNYFTVIDLRSPEDFEKSHIEGALNYPSGFWKSADFLKGPLVQIDPKGPLLLYSQKGQGYGAARRFLEYKTDYVVFYLEFGFSQWLGPMEGSEAEEALEIHKQKSNAYNL